MSTRPIRAALYARLSLDQTGAGVAVDRQLQDCREIAARRGWEVVAEFRDDSRSAWQRDRRRPGWDGLLEAIKHDEVQAVIVWHGDRLVRQPFDLEQLISLVEDKGLLVASIAGERDLGRADDRFILRIETAAQCRESDSTSRRVRRAREAAAQAGRRHGTPYGWRTEDEAEVVRRIVRGLLSGSSLRSLVIALNEEGVPSPSGGQWSATGMRQVAKRWSNAGLRTHHDVVVGPGNWEALVSEAEQEAVLRLLADPDRKVGSGTYRKTLLAGIAVCGVCGGAVNGASKYIGKGRARTPQYRCRERSCTVASRPWVDEIVLAVAQERISGIKPDRGSAEDEARRELAAVSARQDEVAVDYADGAITAAQVRVINARLAERAAAAEERLRTVERRSLVDGDVVLADLDPERQKAILDVLFERVVLNRAIAQGTVQDPARVEFIWR